MGLDRVGFLAVMLMKAREHVSLNIYIALQVYIV